MVEQSHVKYNLSIACEQRLAIALSLADNLAEGLHNSKCKDCKSILNMQKLKINY